jgi:hypothetical protein
MNKPDRYAGLVTALAVLIAIFYTEDKYDGWDIYLGVVGLILGCKYTRKLSRADWFFSLLTASLISISVVACVFGGIGVFDAVKQAICKIPFEKIPFGSSFMWFILSTVVLTVVLHLRTTKGKS